MDELAQQIGQFAKYEEHLNFESDKRFKNWVDWDKSIRVNDDAWIELPKYFSRWLNGEDIKGIEFSHYLIFLYGATIQRFGSDCLQRVAGFKAAIYQPKEILLDNPAETDVWRVAVSVQFMLNLLNHVDNGQNDSGSIAAILDDTKGLFGNLNEHSINVTANNLSAARDVIQRGESNSRCENCNEPVAPFQSHSLRCTVCDEVIRRELESTRKLKSVRAKSNKPDSPTERTNVEFDNEQKMLEQVTKNLPTFDSLTKEFQKAVIARREGMTFVAIERELHISKTTLKRKAGHLFPKGTPGAPKKQTKTRPTKKN